MTDREPASFTAEELSSPATPPATLAQAASVRPDLWPAVLANPNCYPELANWIRQQQPGIVPAALTQTSPSEPTALHPRQGLAQPDASQPGQAQQHHAHPASPPQGFAQPGPGYQGQPGAGAHPAQAGFPHHANAQGAQHPQHSSPGGFADPQAPSKAGAPGPQIGLVIAALLGIIGLVLPLVTISAYGFSASVNYFSEGTDGEGWILLVLFSITLVFGLVAVARQAWARITGGIFALIAGGVAAYDAFDTLSNVNDLAGASAGIGLILLAIAAIALIVLAIVNFAYSKADKVKTPQYHY